MEGASEGKACQATPGCFGVVEDGYCTVCGRIAVRKPSSPPSAGRAAGDGAASQAASGTALSPSGPTPTRRTALAATRSTVRSRIGGGIVSVPPMPVVDPTEAVIPDPQGAENQRFCGSCGAEGGRGMD